jgi:hypothetical protein
LSFSCWLIGPAPYRPAVDGGRSEPIARAEPAYADAVGTGDRPRAALERLAAACDSGRLDESLSAHRVDVLTAFGSAVDPEVDDPRDLDVAVWCGGDGPVDLPGLVEVLTLAADHDVDLAILDTASVVLVSDAVTGRPLGRPGRAWSLRSRCASCRSGWTRHGSASSTSNGSPVDDATTTRPGPDHRGPAVDRAVRGRPRSSLGRDGGRPRA